MRAVRNDISGLLPPLLALIVLAYPAQGALIFVQSFDHGLAPDYTLADETPPAVQGELKMAKGWVTDAVAVGDRSWIEPLADRTAVSFRTVGRIDIGNGTDAWTIGMSRRPGRALNSLE